VLIRKNLKTIIKIGQVERTKFVINMINIPHKEYIGENTQTLLLQLRLDGEECGFVRPHLHVKRDIKKMN